MDRLPVEFAQAGLFPTAEQSLVLTAALANDHAALQAYQTWRSTLRIHDPFDPQVFRLLPLMYDRLRQLGVKDDLTGRLKGTYRQVWARNHRLLDAMRPVLAALSSAGVRTLVLKGAPLALAYYGNVALRPMDDIDLAVRRADVQAALTALRKVGYSLPRVVDESALRYQHAASICGADGRQIDLHWDVMHEFPGERAGELFWQHAEPLEFLDQRTQTLAPTLMLLHTVIHGIRWNAEPPVRWIPDATILLRQRGAEVDWSKIVEIAQAWRLSHRLGLGLRYLRHTVAPEVPESVVRQLEQMPLDWLQCLERKTVLREVNSTYRTLFGPFQLALANSGRRQPDAPPWRAAWSFVDYLRHSWGNGHWRTLFGRLVRGLYARLVRGPVLGLHARWARGG